MKKTLSFLLMIVTIVSFCASCAKQPTDNGIKTLLNIDAKYSVVRPESCSSDVMSATVDLKNTLSSLTGAEITLKEDFLYGDEVPAQYEILVGQTNRDESISALDDIKYNDYVVTVSGDKLVINAYTDEKLLEAIAYVKSLFEKASGSVEFKAEDQKTVRAEYKFDQIKFGDTSLEGYSIVLPMKATNVMKSYAEKLQTLIFEYSGIFLPIKNDAKEETEKEILLGNTSREESKAVKQAALPDNGYSITASGSKIVVKSKDDEFTFVKTVMNIMDEIEMGAFNASEGKLVMNNDPIFTAFCFTDVHNNLAMLEPNNSTKDFIVRKTVSPMIDLILETEGAVDLVMVGGDLMSDYPHADKSGNWPYGYFVKYRQLLVETFARLAKDGKKVVYCGGNHDYGQGEAAVNATNVAEGYEIAAPHTSTGNYNSSDFYFGDAGMRQDVGELAEEDMFWKVGENTGDKYLICYYYKMGDVHVLGLAPDPDIIWNKQGDGFSDESLEWLDKKLDQIDPYGTEIIFINCHYPLDCVYENDDGTLLIRRNSYNYNKLVSIYKGHTNLFHFYGHWESWYHDYSVKAVLHYNGGGEPIAMNGDELSSIDVLGEKKRSFNTVNMGHFRPAFYGQESMFGSDVIMGYGGYSTYKIQHGATRTPKCAQGMYVKVYEDRIVFTMKNYGTYPGMSTEDILESYTVYLYK